MEPTATSGPILVTGSHRSGTTWVGRVLATAPRTRLINEPFNLKNVGRARPFDPGAWFLHIDRDSPADQRAQVAATLRQEGYVQRIRSRKSEALRVPHRFVKRLPSHLTSAIRRLLGDRVIYKDPLAFFSADWLSDELNMTPVVMIRHRAAFVSSLKIKDWQFDFRHLTAQPRLMARLEPHRDAIERFAADPPDIVEQGALLWNCIYGVARDWHVAHPGWHFVRHEDLSLDPVAGFRALFLHLGLPFGQTQIDYIDEVSGAENPTEQTRDQFRRNSRANIDNWKRRLTASEIDVVMTRTEDVRPHFYQDD